MGKITRITTILLILLSSTLYAADVYVTGLVVCEKVAKAAGRYSFFNIKDRLYFKKTDFPVKAAFETPVSIVAKYPRKSLFKAAITTTQGKIIAELPSRIIRLTKYPRFFLISWQGVEFKKPGKYLIKIYLNNKLHYVYPLWVVTLK